MRSFFEETSRKKTRQRTIVAGVFKKAYGTDTGAESLDEIVSLCKTAGANIVGRITQHIDRFSPTFLMGSGKVDELAGLIGKRKADLVVFDSILSPSQQVNLEKKLKIQVIDRPGLILDIFAIHAKTRESRLQVELAQLQYLLPRLVKGWTHLERQEGAIGTRGPGETQLETDRRMVRIRIRDLTRKLEDIEGERKVQRKGRSGLFNVCLVGYTNAGKSTIFNLLTGENVTAEDYLFATLDSTTRRLKLSGRNEILLSDTVGFIKKLPVSLVASFKSTLLEVSGADLLIHVVDLSDGNFPDRIATVNEVLKEIDCGDIPVLLIFNKIDKNHDPDLFRSLLGHYPRARFVSALSGEGLNKLKRDLEFCLEQSRVTVIAAVRPGDSRVIGFLNSSGHISDSISVDGTLHITVRLPQTALGKLEGAGVEFTILDGDHERKE